MRFTNQNFKHVFCWLNLLERKRDQHMDKLLMITFDVFGINWVFVLLRADDGTWWGGSTWVWAQEDFLSKLCLFSQAGLKHPHRALCPNKKTRRGRLCLPVRLLTLTMFDLIGGVLDDWGKVPDMFRQRHSNELNARMMPVLMFALFFTKFIIIRHQNTVKLMVQEMQTLAV